MTVFPILTIPDITLVVLPFPLPPILDALSHCPYSPCHHSLPPPLSFPCLTPHCLPYLILSLPQCSYPSSCHIACFIKTTFPHSYFDCQPGVSPVDARECGTDAHHCMSHPDNGNNGSYSEMLCSLTITVLTHHIRFSPCFFPLNYCYAVTRFMKISLKPTVYY